MKRIAVLAAAAWLAACSPEAEEKTTETAPADITPAATEVPSGTYRLDKSHASLIFRVDHLGFSKYTARFKSFDATLVLDKDDPTRSQLTATVDPNSIETDFPTPETHDFNAALRGETWLDTAKFPQIAFRSTEIEMTRPNAAIVHGELTLHGVTRPVALETVFNGGYVGHPMDPNARIGFSARGAFNRSDFGIVYGIPPEGTTMGVSDNVEVIIEAEFTGPAWEGAPKAE